jgi:O-antigen/teichoic acid export membrane protein
LKIAIRAKQTAYISIGKLTLAGRPGFDTKQSVRSTVSRHWNSIMSQIGQAANPKALPLSTQVGLLTVSRALGQLLNVAVGFILVRKLTQVDYGTFRQISLLATTLFVTELGLVESLYFFIPSFPHRRGIFLRQTVAVVGTMQVVATILLLVCRHSVGVFFNNQQLADCLGLVALYSGFTVMTRMWEVELVAERRIPFAALVGAGFEALKVFLMLVALVVSPGILPILWALTAAAALKFAAFVLYLGREFHWFVATGPVRQGASLFSYAMALWIPGLLNGTISVYGPQYIVAHYSDPSQYAIYAVACFQVPFIAILRNSIAEVFLVRATECHSRGHFEELYALWINACKNALLFYVGVMGVVIAFAKPTVTVLFSKRYDASAPLFALISLGLIFDAILQDSVFRACSAMKAYASFYALRAVLTVGLAFAGLKLWGAWGVALSTIVATVIFNLSQLLSVARLLKVSFSRVLPWADITKIVLAAVIAGVGSSLLLHNLSLLFVKLLIGFALYGIVYAVLLTKLQLISKTEVFASLRELRERFRIAPAIRGTLIALWRLPSSIGLSKVRANDQPQA